ncbi:MAG TPA: hypothetical protein VK582_04530 [Pyrinomonadaceae bacterium]|nr:hypothetical protein [Pyrinomonadaceae bacterium]
MSREVKSAFSAVAFVFALTSLLFAQSGTLPRQKNKAEQERGRVDDRQRQALNERVLSQLEQLFVEAGALNDEEAKITVQVQVADLLWPSDKPRAARMFEDAFRSIEAMGSTDLNADNAASAKDKAVEAQSRLRAELLQLVSTRDAKLAETLVKSVSLPELDLEAERFEISRSDRAKTKFYMESAKRLADIDPQRAVDLAEAYLERQPGAEVLDLLFRIQNKNPALADNLFQHALSIVERDAAASFDIRGLAPYILRNSGGGSPNDASVRRFLELAYSYLSQQSFNQAGAGPANNMYVGRRAAYDYQFAQQLMPYFEQRMPDQVETVRASLNQMSTLVPPESMRELSTDQKPAADLEGLLAKAERSLSAREKDGLYQRAAMLALGGNDTGRALSIAEKISNETMRASTNSMIRYNAAMRAVREKDFTAAYQYLKGVPNLRQRATVFNQMVRMSSGDPEAALSVLSEAEKMLSSAEDGPDKVNALLSLLVVAASLDSNRGFEIMQSAIRALDRLNESAVDNKAAVDEPRRETTDRTATHLTVSDFRGLEVLARSDFDRGLLLAQSIRRREVSVLAQLAVCRGVLITPPDLPPNAIDKVKELDDRKARTKNTGAH